jgi:hypothetical protein
MDSRSEKRLLGAIETIGGAVVMLYSFTFPQRVNGG